MNTLLTSVKATCFAAILIAISLDTKATECTTAIYTSCGVSETGTTSGDPSTGTGEGTCTTADGTAGTAWYSIIGNGNAWTATTVATAGQFDTKIWVFTGNCGALTCVTGNDDGGAGTLSSVSFTPNLGQEYFIVVGGFGGSTGNYQLDITSAGVCSSECNRARTVSCTTSQITGNTTGGTVSGQGACTTGAGTGGADWFTFVGDGGVWSFETVTTAGQFDTKLWVFSGNCGALTCVAGNDDGGAGTLSLVSFTATAGVNYYIIVGGYNANEGNYLLDISSTTCAMSYSSSTTTQSNTNTVSTCATDKEIIGIEIVTTGSSSPFDATQFQINMNGGTNTTDVTNIDIFYTGTNPTFSAIGLFGSAASAGGTISINGNTTLAEGTNYFWIAYDVSVAATVGNLLDAQCTQITMNGTGSTQTPTITSPGGARTIVICPPAPGGVNNGLTIWLDANSQVETGGAAATNGSAVDFWGNKISNINAASVSQGLASDRPTYKTNEFNFNPTIYFDGTDDKLENSFLSSDIIDANSNTIMIVHKYYGGTVIFKFAQNGVGGSTQYEANGANYRFDFMGANTVATSYTNEIEIFSTRTNVAGNLLMNNNGAQILSTGSAGAFPTTQTKDFYIGENPQPAWPLNARMDLAELIIYPRSLTDNEQRQVESYLAMKYGITLGINGTSLDYYNSSLTTIWGAAANSGYAYDIAGVSRDDDSDLSQTKSHSENETAPASGVDRDILTVENSLGFNSDNSALVWGHNDGSLTGSGVTSFTTNNPETITSYFNRHWKSQETGTVGNVTLQFDMSSVIGIGNVAGANNLADIRLLVDADGDFTTDAISISPSSFNNTTDIVEFQHDFVVGTGFFFTIGSVNFQTASLPVDLNYFNGECENKSVQLNWSTSTEINNDYFTIEKSYDAISFEEVATIQGNGNSNILNNYSWSDDNPSNQNNYYRLKQTDFNGKYKYHNTISITNCNENIEVSIYPNPFNDILMVILPENSEQSFKIKIQDYLGRTLIEKPLSGISAIKKIDTSLLKSKGIYFITISDNTNTIIHHQKLIKQ
jgi:hypothetical protein